MLEEARERTRFLLNGVSKEDLVAQHDPIMSPPIWDYGHIGNYEELWLLRAVAGAAPLRPEIDRLYDAFEHPRAERPSLPILGPADARGYLSGVRERVLDVLDRTPLEGDPLLRELDAQSLTWRGKRPKRAA